MTTTHDTIDPPIRGRVYRGPLIEVTPVDCPTRQFIPTGWHYVVYDQRRPHGHQTIRSWAAGSQPAALAECRAAVRDAYLRDPYGGAWIEDRP
jgi:hypothetical protein